MCADVPMSAPACSSMNRKQSLRACAVCNQGPAGKSDRLAHGDFLERLWQRKERLISSHHPLRESIAATGCTSSARLDFLCWSRPAPPSTPASTGGHHGDRCQARARLEFRS